METEKHPITTCTAIDFGVSNTDAVCLTGGKWKQWSRRFQGEPGPETVHEILAAGGLTVEDIQLLAVTGGRHRSLPDRLDGLPIVGVGELAAIGRGGQALAGLDFPDPERPILVVSAGSGTAMVAARGALYEHVTGSGVGGGTLIGLGRLLLGTTDPIDIDRLALAGEAKGVDLILEDVVTGPIGSLPPDATAVNFGRLARLDGAVARVDMAAALVNMIGQVIATLAITAARAARLERIVVTGHMTDMESMRQTLEHVGRFYNFPLELPMNAGYGTAMGALYCALERGE